MADTYWKNPNYEVYYREISTTSSIMVMDSVGNKSITNFGGPVPRFGIDSEVIFDSITQTVFETTYDSVKQAIEDLEPE